MKLRRFAGPNVSSALASVRAALGADAMILETRSSADPREGVVVTAAVDDDPAPNTAPGAGDSILAAEVRELSGLVRTLVGQTVSPGGGMDPELARLYGTLVAGGVNGAIAASFIAETAVRMARGVQLDAALAAAVTAGMAFAPAEAEPEAQADDGARSPAPRVRVFFGPPGEGKTTTIAKLAGRATLEQGRRLGLVSTDTYRLAGADELAAYARILGAPHAVAATAADFRATVERFGALEEILVDTAGLSPQDEVRRRELETLLGDVETVERVLVVSATTSPSVTRGVCTAFGDLDPGACVVTKVDEAPVGGALDALWQRDIRLAFFGTGRSVPRDLEAASAERMAAWLRAA